MEHVEDKPGRTRTVLLLAIGLGLIAVVIAYVLAPGPLMWLCLNGYISAEIWERLRTLFHPLQVLSDCLPPFKQFFEWWMGLWWQE